MVSSVQGLQENSGQACKNPYETHFKVQGSRFFIVKLTQLQSNYVVENLRSQASPTMQHNNTDSKVIQKDFKISEREKKSGIVQYESIYKLLE